MRSRLFTFLSLRLPLFYLVEATLVALFFIQALRFLVGILYARAASASLQPALNPALIDPNLPGLVDPSTVTNEMMFLVYMLAIPLITLILGRIRWLMPLAVLIVALGRYLMIADENISGATSAAIVVGGTLLYLSMIVRHRPRILPIVMVLALAVDQLFRAAGDTLDPSIWAAGYEDWQLFLSIAAVALAIFTTFAQAAIHEEVQPQRGLLTIWGGISFGGLLFLQLSLLALPNAIARRSDSTYTLMVLLTIIATLLPLVPAIQGQARRFISLFDSSVRGWSWMLLTMLFIVIGTRIQGIAAGVMLVLAQFLVSMLWWWLGRPQAQRERSATALWLVLGMLLFALLTVFDIFTYEYAFVRDFAPEFESLNAIIPPLLRGFRGLGLAVILLAVFFAVLPMAQTRRRIAWHGGSASQSLLTLLLIAGSGAGGWYLAQPPVVPGETNPATIRVATYNIHAGYNEFYHYGLEDIAQTISRSGAHVVLLQEVEAGRMTSFSVDQPLWLARRLNMDARFFPTNEGLQGLAVLSRIEIVFDDGNLLASIGSQTGLQRVQIRPDAGVITVYNTWLDPLLDTGGGLSIEELETSQQNQLTQIFGLIRAQHPPDGQLGRTIIGGTFNNLPDSDLIRRIRESNFEDYFADTLERFETFWRTDAKARLDYVWTTRNLQVIGRNVIDSSASDHRLAVIEIELQQ